MENFPVLPNKFKITQARANKTPNANKASNGNPLWTDCPNSVRCPASAVSRIPSGTQQRSSTDMRQGFRVFPSCIVHVRILFPVLILTLWFPFTLFTSLFLSGFPGLQRTPVRGYPLARTSYVQSYRWSITWSLAGFGDVLVTRQRSRGK